jgi:hypothetical protein
LWRSVVLVEQFEDVAERLRREGTTRRQPSRGQVNATLQREPDTTRRPSDRSADARNAKPNSPSHAGART